MSRRHDGSNGRTPNGPTLNGGTPKPADEATDITRWRLLDEHGDQTWHYLEIDEEAKAWPQSSADKYHLGLALVDTQFHISSSMANNVD